MKNLNFKLLLVIFGVAVASSSCNKPANTFNIQKDKQLVKKAIHSSIGWAKNKDIDLLYSVIASDSNYVSVHPEDKVVKGFSEFKKAEKFWMSNDFKAISYEISDLKINFSKPGNIAWFYCMLDDINEWKEQPANWENTRWTGVLEKRNNNWVIVQMHFSFAAN